MELVVVTIVLGIAAAGLRTAPGRPRPLSPPSGSSLLRTVGRLSRP